MSEHNKGMPWSEDQRQIYKAAFDLTCRLLGPTAGLAPDTWVALWLLCEKLGIPIDSLHYFCVDSDGDLLFYGGCWAGWASVERMLTNRGYELAKAT